MLLVYLNKGLISDWNALKMKVALLSCDWCQSSSKPVQSYHGFTYILDHTLHRSLSMSFSLSPILAAQIAFASVSTLLLLSTFPRPFNIPVITIISHTWCITILGLSPSFLSCPLFSFLSAALIVTVPLKKPPSLMSHRFLSSHIKSQHQRLWNLKARHL